MVPPENLTRPHPLKALTEMRAIAEIGSFVATRKILRKYAPSGDGHPVLVIPGFMSGDGLTRSMRRFLEELGYDPYPWKQGTNVGLRDETCAKLEQRIADMHKATGHKVSLIGHSLGGVYVRAIAHRQPQHVRQIITLGTPFNHSFEQPDPNSGGALARAYGRLNAGAHADELPKSKQMSFSPTVPSTSVYSEGDGIVCWEHCLDVSNDQTENICVPGSHSGMNHNPLVMHVIADRLAQAEEHWQLFDPSGLHEIMLKTSCAADVFPRWAREQNALD